ncbi:hypothetical protein BAZ12_05890 [Elizabethkingia miricola]|jgi:hypothetical protein|uniref:Uncharacterized protein n=1 Tax=Elizabethkingia miricola TaxID=172045 RepID=A0ABD4DMB2_ELIMR|nr:hypothetical protein ATB95_00550 [Elizabethkingia miricola]OPC14554.1 hypothetical protein BAY01_09260 [Elizabethkingia miricola]OPC71565.1 hypothetical protein BAZ13_08955 [Elizabethkingia miricola]OPC73311.1 hypothetical protein BAZ12_05890 [Elizabethkingia miricola]
MCFKAKIKFFYTASLSKTISSGFKITLLCIVIKEKTAEFSGHNLYEDDSCSFPPTAKGCFNLVTPVLELN